MIRTATCSAYHIPWYLVPWYQVCTGKTGNGGCLDVRIRFVNAKVKAALALSDTMLCTVILSTYRAPSIQKLTALSYAYCENNNASSASRRSGVGASCYEYRIWVVCVYPQAANCQSYA